MGKTSEQGGAVACPGLSGIAVCEAGRDNHVIHLSWQELGNRGCGWTLRIPAALGGAAKEYDLGVA